MAVVNVSDQDFSDKVLNSSLPVVVDFFATWCGPCKMAEPVLEELSNEHQDKVLFVKVDVDQNPMTAQKYGVMSIPTTVLIEKGSEKGRVVGFSGKQSFIDLITKAG